MSSLEQHALLSAACTDHLHVSSCVGHLNCHNSTKTKHTDGLIF